MMATVLFYLVPLLLIAALAVILVGVFNLTKPGIEQRRRSNRLMRWRIVIQAVAILVILLLVTVFAKG
ncbi:MAG: twin transmembrane helix small protein [Alphaproteobacteria bacterium]|nr:MAG: twin transmembrane helix small protein [Alphaproteobacteria bacterium]